MPIAPCPERLRKLIKRLNQESGVEAQQLKLILRSIENKDQEYSVKLSSTITVDLTDFSVHIRHPLSDALLAIDPPELIQRIRTCPVCSDFFWAGRTGKTGKKACDKHGDRVRKRNNRRDIKKREIAAATEQRKQEARTTLAAMTTTARSVIRAIMVKDARLFCEIDGACWHQFDDDDRKPRSTRIIRNVTHRLYKDGYLDYFDSPDNRDKRGFSLKDRYAVTDKLDDLWRDADIEDLELD